MVLWVFLNGACGLAWAQIQGSREINLGGFDTISLQKTSGEFIKLSQYNSKGFILVFTCNHCPFAQLYTQRLNDLSMKYASLGVPLIAVNAMDSLMYEEESLNLMRDKVLKEGYNFPYVRDYSQTLAKKFHAENTPQVFIIWKQNGFAKLAYSGSIDDNGQEPSQVQHAYVDLAMHELFNNKPITVPYTESFGCKIFYRKQK